MSSSELAKPRAIKCFSLIGPRKVLLNNVEASVYHSIGIMHAAAKTHNDTESSFPRRLQLFRFSRGK